MNCYRKWQIKSGWFNNRPSNWTEKGKETLRRLGIEQGKASTNRFKALSKKEKIEWVRKMAKSRAQRPTKPEKAIIELIKKYKLEYKYTGNAKYWIEKINPDFVNSNGKKIIIEVYGDYWHNLPQRKKKDKLKDKKLKEYGWKKLVLWEKEINNNNDEYILNKIKEVENAS